MTVEELESLRLCDKDGLYQEEAARGMGVSRATFGRLLESARRKTATALVGGMVITIEGGHHEMSEEKKRVCCGGKGHGKSQDDGGLKELCGCGGKGLKRITVLGEDGVGETAEKGHVCCGGKAAKKA